MDINTEDISLEFEINDRDTYSSLSGKPKINSVELNGNKSLSDLGITTEEEIDAKDTETLNTAKAYTDGITDGLDERVSENEEDIAALLADIETKADRSELPEKLSDLTNDTDFVSESVIDSKDTATLNTAKAYTDTEIGGLDIPEKLSDLTDYLILPTVNEGVKPSWFGYLISVKENAPFTKQQLVEYLESHKVGTRQLFAGNILRQPMIVDNDVDFRIGSSSLMNSKDLTEDDYKKLPKTDFIMNNTFWVGTFPALGEEEISRISDAIHACVEVKINAKN